MDVINFMSMGRKEIVYLTTHSTHFIYGYMELDIMVKDHSDSERGNPLSQMGYSFRLAARVLLYPSSHRQGNTYHQSWSTGMNVMNMGYSVVYPCFKSWLMLY